jgi:hypothetical protein
MQLTMMSDILFHGVPAPARLREAVAQAFDVPVSLVNLRTVGDLDPVDPASRVQITRQPEPLPGDFAEWYGLGVAPDLVNRVDDAVNAIASMLGMVLLTDADDDEDMTLHLPDGSERVVHLEQGEDDAFRLTPEMRQHIERAARPPRTGRQRKATAR